MSDEALDAVQTWKSIYCSVCGGVKPGEGGYEGDDPCVQSVGCREDQEYQDRIEGEQDQAQRKVVRMSDNNSERQEHPDGAACMVASLVGASAWLTTLAKNGPDLRIHAHRKAAHEARELADTPTTDEWADVAICLVAVALGQGWSTETLADAVSAKVKVNEARTWLQLPDGTWQHSDDAAVTAGAGVVAALQVEIDDDARTIPFARGKRTAFRLAQKIAEPYEQELLLLRTLLGEWAERYGLRETKRDDSDLMVRTSVALRPKKGETP